MKILYYLKIFYVKCSYKTSKKKLSFTFVYRAEKVLHFFTSRKFYNYSNNLTLGEIHVDVSQVWIRNLSYRIHDCLTSLANSQATRGLHPWMSAVTCKQVSPADVLKFPSHFLDFQQFLSDQTMKCTVISCRTKQFFIGKSDKSDSFQELGTCPPQYIAFVAPAKQILFKCI